MLRSITAGAAMMAALAIPGSALAAPPNQPDEMMIIDVVSAIGSGCLPGTAAVAVSPDNKAFTIAYSEYTATVGPEAKGPGAFRKTCNLGLMIKVPSGYTFAIASTDHRGYARLAPGADAVESTDYYFQGQSKQTTSTHKFKGAMDKKWKITDDVAIESLNYLPCGLKRNLNINTALVVNRGQSSPKASSLISMDSTDTSIETLFRITWQKCKK